MTLRSSRPVAIDAYLLNDTLAPFGVSGPDRRTNRPAKVPLPCQRLATRSPSASWSSTETWKYLWPASRSRFGLSPPLPGQAALDLQIERKAQESSDQDNAPKDANALKCRRSGDGADDVTCN
jgi:hypothetical protein